jgi:hypothetical protein
MTLPADAAARVAKLIPMLGSDNDGEVVATVRALRRVLAGAGSDLHGLAAVVAGASPAPRPGPQPQPRPGYGHPDTNAARAWAEMERNMRDQAEAAIRRMEARQAARQVAEQTIDRITKTSPVRYGSTAQRWNDFEDIHRVPWGLADWLAVVDAAAFLMRTRGNTRVSDVDRMFITRVVMLADAGDWNTFSASRRARLVEIMLGMVPTLPQPFAHEKMRGV